MNLSSLHILMNTFQLHTVHQELGNFRLEDFVRIPFNSTRYIRNSCCGGGAGVGQSAFNSTRYIRNGVKECCPDLLAPFAFQLHTVHQELILFVLFRGKLAAFNSTRCIRNMALYLCNAFSLNMSFNSTRCIRNQAEPFREFLEELGFLSTPHGALGTFRSLEIFNLNPVAFQLHTVHQEPGRRIENKVKRKILSTPHGALGTQDVYTLRIEQPVITFQLHTVHQEQNIWIIGYGLDYIFQLHTVHQEHKTILIYSWWLMRLSTPHGALGTREGQSLLVVKEVFQLHTVHQEPQIATLIKIRHINNFVKRAPISNEVNFPKSEIMQS